MKARDVAQGASAVAIAMGERPQFEWAQNGKMMGIG